MTAEGWADYVRRLSLTSGRFIGFLSYVASWIRGSALIGVARVSKGTTWDVAQAKNQPGTSYLVRRTGMAGRWGKPVSLSASREKRRDLHRWSVACAGALLRFLLCALWICQQNAHVRPYSRRFFVIAAAGAPAYLAVLSLAYFSNLNASLTHYGTTPAPIYFGAGYVSQRQWWMLGLMVSVPNILIWTVFGFGWWKLLGWW